MDALVIYFGGAVLVALAMYISQSKLIDHLLFIPFIILQVYITVHEGFNLDTIEDEYFKTDKLGFIFLVVLTIISIPSIIHAIIYSMNRDETNLETSIHDSALVMLITMMTGALISNNLGLIWAFVEATSICAAVLIYHDRNPQALEAAWKYIFVASIGVAIAFVGILVLGIAMQGPGEVNFSIDAIKENVMHMDEKWLKISFIMIVCGYSVKMGVVPLFTVDIDAKDAAPSPIGAVISGGLMNVGFIAIFRFYEIFSFTAIHSWMNKIFLIVGVLSVLFATVYIIKIKNFKRLLAYSSLEHAGIVLIAISVGSYVAAILHLVFHALTKASLFNQLGHVYRLYRGKDIDQIGGYFRINPYGAFAVLVGLFCVTAMPPSGMFLTEYWIFQSLFRIDSWLYSSVAVILLVLLTFVIYAMGKNFFRLLFTPVSDDTIVEKVSPWEAVSQWMMLFVVIMFGIYTPLEVLEFIQMSVKHLPVKL